MNKYLSLALSLSFLAPGVFAETKKVDKERENIEKFMKIHCYKAEGLNSCLKRTKPQFKIGLETSKIKGATSKKYTACNDWLQNTFPKDKMIQIGAEGKILKGENATQHFVQDNKGGNTLVSNISYGKNNKNITHAIELSVQKDPKKPNSFSIGRTVSYEDKTPSNWQNYGINMGYGQRTNYNFDHFPTNPFVVTNAPTAWSSELAKKYQIGRNYNDYGENERKENLKRSKVLAGMENSFTKIHFSIGENGNCLVSNVAYKDKGEKIKTANTYTCKDLMDFKEKHPNIEKCVDPNIFKELKSIINHPREVNFEERNDTLDGEFLSGMSESHRLIYKSALKLQKCNDFNLRTFIKDDALFMSSKSNKDGKTNEVKAIKEN